MRNNGLIKCPKTVYQEQRRCLLWGDFPVNGSNNKGGDTVSVQQKWTNLQDEF